VMAKTHGFDGWCGNFNIFMSLVDTAGLLTYQYHCYTIQVRV
jgi:hypothetical protein